MSNSPLPTHYKDHALTGNWSDYRDCHLSPDLVLIYKFDDDTLTLVRLGSHSELSLLILDRRFCLRFLVGLRLTQICGVLA